MIIDKQHTHHYGKEYAEEWDAEEKGNHISRASQEPRNEPQQPIEVRHRESS